MKKLSSLALLSLVVISSAAILNFSGCANKNASTKVHGRGHRLGKSHGKHFSGKHHVGKGHFHKAAGPRAEGRKHFGKGHGAWKKGTHKPGVGNQGPWRRAEGCAQPECNTPPVEAEVMVPTSDETTVVEVSETVVPKKSWWQRFWHRNDADAE